MSTPLLRAGDTAIIPRFDIVRMFVIRFPYIPIDVDSISTFSSQPSAVLGGSCFGIGENAFCSIHTLRPNLRIIDTQFGSCTVLKYRIKNFRARSLRMSTASVVSSWRGK